MPEKQKNDRLNNKDEVTGKFLSRKARKNMPKTVCPPMENIAAFIDGNLGIEEKEAMMAHFNSCEECYELFSGTVETIEREREESRKKPGTLFLKFFPLALAAAAVFLIFFQFPLKDASRRISPVSQRIASLASHLGAGDAPGADGEPALSPAYGFGASEPRESVSMKIGTGFADLEFLLASNDKERALRLLDAILSLIPSLEESGEAISLLADMKREMERDVPLQKLGGRIFRISFRDESVNSLVEFGAWLEGGRIAAAMERKEFFDKGDAGHFFQILKWEGLPKGMKESLGAVKEIIEKEVITETEFRRLEKEFRRMISLV